MSNHDTSPFTEAERATLLSHEYEIDEDDGCIAYNGYLKLVKKAADRFVLRSWMDDGEGSGYWDEGDDHSTLDFL